MMNNTKVLVIIPVYNESESIEGVINKLKRDCPSYDYIVINDCSKDNTKDLLYKMNACYVSLPVNLGIGGGVQTGYIYALENGYDIAVQVDGDGQHDTQYVEYLVNMIESGKADIAIGSRFIDKKGFQSTGMRRMGINILSQLIYFCTKIRIKDVTSGFRAVNREYISIYANNYPTDYPEPEALVLAAVNGASISEVPVVMKEREFGSSSIYAWKNVYYMIKVSLAIILCKLTEDKRK